MTNIAEIFTFPVLALLLMLVIFGCYAGWVRDMDRARDSESIGDFFPEDGIAYEFEEEAPVAHHHAPRAVDLASSGIYDWRKSGL